MSVYKGEKLVAGISADTHFVRRPAWNRAMDLPIILLRSGYKAQVDGMIFGVIYNPETGGATRYLTVNGTNLLPLPAKPSNYTTNPVTLSLTVNQGDIISCTTPDKDIAAFSPIQFVPFEDS